VLKNDLTQEEYVRIKKTDLQFVLDKLREIKEIVKVAKT